MEVPEGLAAVSVPAKDVQAVGGGGCERGRRWTCTRRAARPPIFWRAMSSCWPRARRRTMPHRMPRCPGSRWLWSPTACREVVSAAQRTELYFALPGGEASGQAGDEREREARYERCCRVVRGYDELAYPRPSALGREPCGAGMVAAVFERRGGPEVPWRGSTVSEVWVASSDDVEPINLAATLKRDRADRRVCLLSFEERDRS